MGPRLSKSSGDTEHLAKGRRHALRTAPHSKKLAAAPLPSNVVDYVVGLDEDWLVDDAAPASKSVSVASP